MYALRYRRVTYEFIICLAVLVFSKEFKHAATIDLLL